MQKYRHYNLKTHHTFGIDVYADEFVVLGSNEEVQAFIRSIPARFLILGGGSNILFLDDFHGTVVKIATKGIHLVNETDDEVIVSAAAGEDWDVFVEYCAQHGWGGLENLSGIPGNVGSSPIQNIGAYGTELKDHFHSLHAVNLLDQSKMVLTGEQCGFGYRDSIFKRELKGRVIITEVLFRLKKSPKPNLSYQALANRFLGVPDEMIDIMKVREAVLEIRNSKLPDPRVLGNAGSFFKNPLISKEKTDQLKERFPGVVYFLNPPPSPLPDISEGDGGWVNLNQDYKLAAGWLIEQCGWKGFRDGDAGVHKDQALVLVNYGRATGRQIFDLSEKIRLSVMDKFGVELEREVNVI